MSNELYLGQPPTDNTVWIKKYATPFYFEVLEDGHIQLNKSDTSITYEISLLYSLDNKTWQDWDYLTGTDVIAGQKFYLKSKTDIGYFNKNYTEFSGYYYFSSTNKINVVGNIMSLLYNDFASKLTISNDYVFTYLFYNCTTLIDASNLILPATKLTNRCYSCMFNKCSKLTKPPKELPALNLTGAEYCYISMFYMCTSLTETPNLPATKLGNFCYTMMFNNCTSLTKVSDLPCKDLTKTCYMRMFYQCRVLVNGPNIYATSFVGNPFIAMFSGNSKMESIHYSKELQANEEFLSLANSPWFGAPNATVYYDL